MEQIFVSIDVHVRPSGEAFAVARDGKGLNEPVARLRRRDVALRRGFRRVPRSSGADGSPVSMERGMIFMQARRYAIMGDCRVSAPANASPGARWTRTTSS